MRDTRTSTLRGAAGKPKPWATIVRADGSWRCGWCDRDVPPNTMHDFDPHDACGPGLVTPR